MPDLSIQLAAHRARSAPAETLVVDRSAADQVAAPSRPTPASGAAAPARRCFRTGQVARILGVTHRQLQYWAETGLVVPSVRTGGGHRRYTFEDLVALRAARQLIDAGVSIQRIRRSIGALARLLPAVRRPLSELVLVATGDLVLVLRDGAAFEALSGQEWILEVSRFEREIHERLGPEPGAARRRARVAAKEDRPDLE